MTTGTSSILPPGIESIVDETVVRCPACGGAMHPAPRLYEMAARRGDFRPAHSGRPERAADRQPYYCVGCNAWLVTSAGGV